jgi:hypothetical protein
VFHRTNSCRLFAPTRRTAAARRKPGRPPEHDQAWRKVIVALFNRQNPGPRAPLREHPRRSGAAISRAQLIRALLDAVAGAEVDLTTATSEPDLKASILALLGKSRLAMSGV